MHNYTRTQKTEYQHFVMKRIPYTWHSAIQGIKYETLNYLTCANDIGEHDMTFDIDGTRHI